ncbi:uncharacterized protein [Antedon mediterranea]
MSYWVQQICHVCGFCSDQENPEDEEDIAYPSPGVPMLPVQTSEQMFHFQPELQQMVPSPEANGRVNHDTSTPEVENESYVKIWEENRENGELQNGHMDFRERKSSLPDSPAPSPPNNIYNVPRKQPTYDVPPPPVVWHQPVYDVPPPSKFVQDIHAMEDEDNPLSILGHRRLSIDGPSRTFDRQISLINGEEEDSPRSSCGLILDEVENSIYQVPPNNKLVHNPLLVHLKDDVSKSTDDLAQKFKLISKTNQSRPNYGERENIYMNDIQKSPEAPPRPPKPPSLTTSETSSSSILISPARVQDDNVFYSTQNQGQWYEPMVSNSPYKSPPVRAPARPPKPESFRINHSGPATPPPSFDEAYGQQKQMGVSPRLLEGRLSETGIFEDLYAPMSASPAALSFASTNGSSALSDFFPTNRRESGDGYQNLRDDDRCSINPPTCLVNTGLYMPMQGSSNPSPGFSTQSDTHYLPMQSSLDDADDDYYKRLKEQPVVPPHSVPLPKTLSVPSRLVPPPVDRSIKPNRIDGDNIGMHGSYYATDNEPRESRKTKSFHKTRDHRLYAASQDKLQVPVDRHDSSSSNASSSDALTPIGERFLDHDEGTHVIVKPGLKGIGMPTSPDEIKHDVVYTELSHGNTPSNAQATPKKDLSSKVDYVDLDPEKTQALKNIIEDRESERPR